jgi:two-component system, OmpR family, KDP operon response regulator KdpE
VDDDSSNRKALRTILSSFRFEIVETAHGEEALELLQATQIDAVLLEINLPGLNGIELCRRMRNCWPRLPIIVLTVLDGEDSKVEALDAGADDYVTKPFQMRELTARLRAAVRRSSVFDDEQAAITIGELMLDPESYRVEKRGRLIRMTRKEFELLHLLMMRAGMPIPHNKLLRSVWGWEHGGELEYLRTYIRQIRMKIEDDPANPKYLLTEPGVGYMFVGSKQENA